MQNQGAEHTAPNLLCFVLPFCNLHYEKFADGTVKCIEDEIPFDLPKGWEWERLSNIACFSGGKTPSTSDRACWGGNVLWVTSKDMKSKYIQSSMLKLSEKGLEQMQLYPANTLLLVTRSGILRHTLPVAILKESATINQDIKAILPYISDLEEYIYICLKGMESRLILQYTKAGATVENINFDAFKRILLPIPPQKQIPLIISATIDAESIINILKINQENLIDTITKTKSKILDLAIRGKLVPQDPNDEPASVLLERIRAEKEELIRQGKIKRDKKDSVIFKGEDNSYYEKVGSQVICIDSEIPFDLPTNWAWTHMREICIINPRSSVPDNTEVSFIPMPLIQEGFANSHSSENRFWVQVKSGFTHFHENDIGVAKITPCFENRKSVVFHNLKNGIGAGTTELHILRPKNNFILSEYILMILKTNNFILEGVQTFSSAVGQQRIRKEYVADYLVPLPPYQEQQRIYSRVSRIFDQLSDIETNLS